MARWASRGSVSPCSCVAIYTSQQGWGSRPLRREVQALGVQDVCCLERMQRGFTEPLHKQLPQSPKDRKATTRMDALATKYQLPTRWRSGAGKSARKPATFGYDLQSILCSFAAFKRTSFLQSGLPLRMI